MSYWCSLRLKMLGKGVWLKNTTMLVFFLLLKKCLKNLWILGLMITEGNHSEFQRGFRSSWSTADLLLAAPDRIARAFNKSEATPAVALDISKAFKRVWHANLSYKLKFLYCSGIWPFWSFLRSSWPHVILNWKSSQEYPVNAGVPWDSIFGSTPFLLHINDLPDEVTCNIAMYANDTTLSVIRHMICGNN